MDLVIKIACFQLFLRYTVTLHEAHTIYQLENYATSLV